MSGGASGSWRVELTPWASPWDKMFEDSDSDLLGDGTGCVHNSVKPLLPLDHESNFTTKLGVWWGQGPGGQPTCHPALSRAPLAPLPGQGPAPQFSRWLYGPGRSEIQYQAPLITTPLPDYYPTPSLQQPTHTVCLPIAAAAYREVFPPAILPPPLPRHDSLPLHSKP